MRPLHSNEIHLWTLNADKGSHRQPVRKILARYLSCHESDIQMAFGERGKPRIESPKSNLYFNLSHSKGVAILALSNDDIGVDLEEVRPDVSMQKIVHRFYSSEIFEKIQTLPTANERTQFFFKLWVFSEALVKGNAQSIFQLEEWKEYLKNLESSTVHLDVGNWRITDLTNDWPNNSGTFRMAVALKNTSPDVRFQYFQYPQDLLS